MPPDLSVVIPVHNEALNLEALCREMADVLGAWGRSYELILIDDGSTDESFAVMKRLQSADPHLRLIRFRRNFGQTAAFAAGFAHARGHLVATADGDMQNDPRDIAAMVDRLDTGGFDVVCGWRRDRKDPFLSRRLPARLAGRLISWVTGVRLNDYGCSLKLYRADVVKDLRLYGEMHRFLPALAFANGARIAEQAVNHRPRVHGQSKYGISRTLRVVLDLMTVKFLSGYSTRPVHVFGTMGLGLGVIGVGLLGYAGATHLFWPAAIAARSAMWAGALACLSGLQLVALGLVAELLARTYFESQDRATYRIREIVETT
jgi:glycosyltransferase involved in cell wall biosynthesis